MSIDIIEVITLEEVREVGIANQYADERVQEAINLTFLQLNGQCNHNISKRWNVEDATNPLYITPEKKQYVKEAFILQIEYNLVNNLNQSSVGSQQTSLGSWSHSYNNPKDKDYILPAVIDLLVQAGLMKNVNGMSMNVIDKKGCIPSAFWEERMEGDAADLAFVRWGEANDKFLPKFIGLDSANKFLYVNTNGYIRTIDTIDIIAPILVDYYTKSECNDLFLTKEESKEWHPTFDYVRTHYQRKNDILVVDITQRDLGSTTMQPNSWINMGFMVELPVDYDFEILGVVSSNAQFSNTNGLAFPTNVFRIIKSNNNDYNVYVEVLFYSPYSAEQTGNLVFDAKLLIRKV